jgi:3D (Asp-Asp-Asp) domain-containing protein
VILKHTYYRFADTNDYPGAASDTPIYMPDGTLIAMVPQRFSFDLSLEGSGMLADGRVVNYAGTGAGCVRGTPGYSGISYCYRVLDGTRYPWGQGHGVPVEPLRSLAVDPRYIPWGSVVYIREFDGLRIPALTDSRGRTVGGFVHDGLFRAEDSGGAIGANHIDIYAGPTAMYRWLERAIPTSYPNGTGLTAELRPASSAPPRNLSPAAVATGLKPSSGGDGTLAVAVALIAMGVGGLVYLEHVAREGDRKRFAPRSNPWGFLV